MTIWLLATKRHAQLFQRRCEAIFRHWHIQTSSDLQPLNEGMVVQLYLKRSTNAQLYLVCRFCLTSHWVISSHIRSQFWPLTCLMPAIWIAVSAPHRHIWFSTPVEKAGGPATLRCSDNLKSATPGGSEVCAGLQEDIWDACNSKIGAVRGNRGAEALSLGHLLVALLLFLPPGNE